MLLPEQQVAHALVVVATDCQRMSSATFIIKKGKHIEVHLEYILVQIDIVRTDWVREFVKIVALKYFFIVTSRSNAITNNFWKSVSFVKVQKRGPEAALVLV